MLNLLLVVAIAVLVAWFITERLWDRELQLQAENVERMESKVAHRMSSGTRERGK